METSNLSKPQRGMFSILRYMPLILTLGLLSACSSGVKLDDSQGAPVEDRAGTAVQPGGGASSATRPAPSDPRAVTKVDIAGDPLNDPKSPLALRSVYFDYDSFIIAEKYRATVEAHAKYLLSNKGRKVVIQGNADERGGSEYNLALGQKRADAVRRALAQRGVTESQMEAVSYGKEKPKAQGSNEEAWKENRRADIIY